MARSGITAGVLWAAMAAAGWAQALSKDDVARQAAFAAKHAPDWRKCKVCVPALTQVAGYLKENVRKLDEGYDGCLGTFYGGFYFLAEGGSPKELDLCLKKARHFIKQTPGYNPWLAGMSALLLTEASLKHGLTGENRDAIADALRFLSKAQEKTGGWHHGNNDYYTKDIAMVSSIVHAVLVEAKALGIDPGAALAKGRAYLDEICGQSFGYSSGGKDGDTAAGRGAYTQVALLGTWQLNDPLVKKLGGALEARYMNCAQGHANGDLHFWGVGAALHRTGPEPYRRYASIYLDRVIPMIQPDGSVGDFPCDTPEEQEPAAYERMKTRDDKGYGGRFASTAVLGCMILWQQDGAFKPKLPKKGPGKPAPEAVSTPGEGKR
jgi:hypothetical protein